MQSIRKKLAGKQSKLATVREKMEDHPADVNGYQDGAFFNVDITDIHPDPDQPRKYFDPEPLAELSESIKQKGVLQPVIIRKNEDGNIYLVAGERRFRAAKMAGLERIPCIMTKGNPMEIALIENLQRENLRPIEEAEALGRMVEEYEYTHEQLALVIGKSRSTITETLSLNKLPEPIKEECRRADNYPRRLLIEVAKQKNTEAMMDLFNQIKEGNLKSAEVRQIARKRNPAPVRSAVTITLEKTENLSKQLKKIDLEKLQESERGRILLALQNLKQLLEKLIS